MRPLTRLGVLLLSAAALTAMLTGGSHAQPLKLPKGFGIHIFASGLDKPRFMATSPDGVLFVALINSGEIAALPDMNGDGRADRVIKVIRGLNHPHDLAFHGGYLYVSEPQRISRYRYIDHETPLRAGSTVVGGLPDGHHFTRTISFGPDGMLYVSIGSSCNVCVEKDRRRGTIMRFSPDGSRGEVFARGLRNSVGLAWHPVTGELWATENGRDWLGDDLPPDEINIIKRGGNYGWPRCYGDRVPEPKLGRAGYCASTVRPALEIQAHSAPLGIEFYTGLEFPPAYRGDIFVAYHGSWNRSVPTGYKVVRIGMKDGGPVGIEDFITGWIMGDRVRGRPVGLHTGKGGELYISDDHGGRVYVVTYDGP